jgi:hypothetical protein
VTDRVPGVPATPPEQLSNERPSPLQAEDLPELFQSADAASLRAQQNFIRSSAAQLVLLVLAAAAGPVSFALETIDLGHFSAATFFILAAILKTHMLATKPDMVWYQARAAAESAKTLAWRYAVGGEPFRLSDTTKRDTDRLFLQRLLETLKSLVGIPLVPLEGAQITDRMRALRGRPLEERKRVYERGRIENQRVWYARKAAWNNRRAGMWGAIMLSLELIGAVAALLWAAGPDLLDYDILGVSATAVGTVAAWTQTKQHVNLANAYSVSARELAGVQALIGDPGTEQEWAEFVAHAEEAISREHTLWRASRGS